MPDDEPVESGDHMQVIGAFIDGEIKIALQFGESQYRVSLDAAKTIRDALTAVISETERQIAEMN